MNRYQKVILLIIDGLGGALALYLTYMLRFESSLFQSDPMTQAVQASGSITVFWWSLTPMLVYWWIVFALNRLYVRNVVISRFDELTKVFKSVVIGIVILYFITFDIKQPLTFTKIGLVSYAIGMFVFVGMGRFIFRNVQRYLRWRGIGLEDAIIIGYNEIGLQLYNQLSQYPVWGFRILGFVDDEFKDDLRGNGLKKLGNINDLPDIVTNNKINWILIAPLKANNHKLMELLNLCIGLPVRVMLVADYYQMVVGLVGTIHIHGLPLIEVSRNLVSPLVIILKRLIDIVVGLVMSGFVILLTPLIAAIIKIDSPGPVFYTQRRVGRYGKEFTMYKFRSMVRDAEKRTGVVWAKRNDPRITRVGRFLRRTHLDELPQFFNVLLGHMSLVGPRPERREFVAEFRHKVPLYERRLIIRPGITGWAQIRHKYDETLHDVIEKTRYDIYYIDHISLSLDLKIILATFLKILRGEGI